LLVNRVNSGSDCLQPLLGDHATVECDVHAASSMVLVYNRNGTDTHATARHGKHHVTCYKDQATVAGQRKRAQQRHGKHHVTQQ
jgi:hypothetical protein